MTGGLAQGETLLLDAQEVRAILTPQAAIAALEEAFSAMAAENAVQPLRVAAWRPDQQGAIAAMPAFLGRPAVLGAKVIAVFPENSRAGLPSHQGVVVLHDAEDGRCLAIVDAGAITAIRTAAASALATRLLAREDAQVLALLGSGEQAHEHLRAIRTVRAIREVRVFSRTAAHAQTFAAVAERAEGLPVRGAQIICTLTAAREPVLLGRWLEPGAHVNAVGASTPAFRELDAQAISRSILFTDRAESLSAESEDYLGALREGAISEGHLRGELAQLVAGSRTGRTSPEEITLFKSLGLAIEDVAAAHRVYREAIAQGHGLRIRLGGEARPGTGA